MNRPVAFIASGDLSHRLKPGAPAGYHANAHLFDEEVVAAIRNGETTRITNIDQNLRHQAGECGYRSMLVAFGVVEDSNPSCEVLSYEAPWGVGYLVAQLMNLTPSPSGRGLGEGSSTSSSSLNSFQPAKRATDDNDQPPAMPTGRDSDFIPALARQTIETFVRDNIIIAPPKDLPDELTARAGCFVSIKTREGDLRGCCLLYTSDAADE